MTICLDDYADLERDADSELAVSTDQYARLKRDWASYSKGTIFYIVSFVPCVGGNVLRWNAKAVLNGERISDPFFHRTVPAELLRPVELTKRSYRKGRLTVTLDRSEVFPDDPGQGTPAIVRAFDATATYWCALDNGLMRPDGLELLLTANEYDWLVDLEQEILAFLSL